MVDISKASARMWSRLGSRAIYGQAVMKLAEINQDVLALSADLGSSSGLSPFMRKYPARFVNVGIAEQNMVGISAGLAKEGFIPFISSFAPFMSMRASEQIRMELGYMKHNVKVVSLASGLGLNFLGNSHYGLEDVSVMRSIPNICVISPADCAEIFKAVKASAEYNGPVYIRLTGDVNNPSVYQEDYNFEIGKSVLLEEGQDVLIIASGTMVYQAIKASEILHGKGISCTVLNMHTIKPLDVKAIEQHSKNKNLLVTVEEHTVCGGLGSAVAEHFSSHTRKPPHLILGLPDRFGPTAEYEYLLDYYGLNGQGISDAIIEKHEKVQNDK